MVLRIILFAMMAMGLGGFGIIAWVSTRQPPAAIAEAAPEPEVKAEPAKPVAKVAVLVASRAVRAGSMLKPEEITAREFLENTLPDGITVDGATARHSLVGAMVRRALAPGEPLMAADLMRPGDHGFLAAVLGPDMSAVTVAVDVVSGSAGLIWPGDRVDVVLTAQNDNPSLPLANRFSAEMLLRATRVIAIDQQLVQGAHPGGADGITARTVTLEVTAEQVQRVQVAARIGRLSLSVRASANGSADEATKVVYAGDVSSALRNETPRRQTDRIRIHAGTADSKEYPVQ